MSQAFATDPAHDAGVALGDEPLYEVIDGRVVERPPMSSRETHIASILVGFLTHHVWAHELGRVEGEMLFRLDPGRDQKRRPDVAFVSFGRWPKHRRVPVSHGWQVVPDLAIEVVSPTDGAVELLEKLEEYFLAGVRRAWVVFPARRCVYDYSSFTEIAVLRVGDRLEGGDLLPGFALTLAELFEIDLADDEVGPDDGDEVKDGGG